MKDIIGTPLDAPDEQIIKELRDKYKAAEYALDEEGDTSNSSKWYDHTKDLRAFSKEFPGIFFHLHGEGEESEDLWNATFFEGKMHHRQAEFNIEPFNVAKLE